MQTSPAKEVLTSPIRIRNFALSAALGQSGLLAGGAGKSKQQRRGKQVISTGLVNGPLTNGEACESNLQVIGAQAKREQAKSINVTNGNSNGNGSCGLSIVGGGGILASHSNAGERKSLTSSVWALQFVRDSTRQKVIRKARNSLSSMGDERGKAASKSEGAVTSTPVLRTKSASAVTGVRGLDRERGKRGDSAGFKGSKAARSSGSSRSRTRGTAVGGSFVNKIQHEVASCAFNDLSVAISTQKVGRPANKTLTAESAEASLNLEKQRLLAAARVSERKRTLQSKKEKQNQLDQDKKEKRKLSDADLEQMRLLASQRALEAQKEAKIRQQIEIKKQEEARAQKANQRKKEEQAKMKRRAEIYAINAVMRNAFDNRFRAFVAEKLVSGDGAHAILEDELAADLRMEDSSEVVSAVGKVSGVGVAAV